MSEASRRAASARGFKDYVKFRGEKYTRNEGRSWNRGWKAAAAYFDTAIARAVEGERAKFREYVDEMCECPLFIRNRAALRAPAKETSDG